MNDLMLTFPIEKKEFDGQMVVTLKDIDTLHQKPEGSARKRFNDNRRHFIEGTDFFRVSPGQLSEIRTVENQESGIRSNNGGYVFTQTGYLMIVKSFTDTPAVRSSMSTPRSAARRKPSLLRTLSMMAFVSGVSSCRSTYSCASISNSLYSNMRILLQNFMGCSVERGSLLWYNGFTLRETSGVQT